MQYMSKHFSKLGDHYQYLGNLSWVEKPKRSIFLMLFLKAFKSCYSPV